MVFGTLGKVGGGLNPGSQGQTLAGSCQHLPVNWTLEPTHQGLNSDGEDVGKDAFLMDKEKCKSLDTDINR